MRAAAAPLPCAEVRPPSRTTPVAAACVVLSGLSLLVPAGISFDAWGWLVWGREAAHLALDTSAGPSWKPLPVVATTVLSVFGDAAPMLWMVLARAAGLLLVVVTFRLAARAAGTAAGAAAAALLVLTPDPYPRFLRVVLEGHGAPVAAALALWAIERHLEGRRAQALLLGTGLALMRPEAWPFLGLYAAWLWGRDPQRRRLVAVALVSVPVLWFGGDWWGSGDPWHGADVAQVASGGAFDRLRMSLERAGELVVAPAWVAAAAGMVTAGRRGERSLVALGAGAAAWCALVVTMAVALRYAALSRFLLPAGALVCVLAGVGAVRLLAAAARSPAGVAAAAVAILACAPLGVPRLLGVDDVIEGVRARAGAQDGIAVAIERAGGREAVLACGPVAVDDSSLVRPAVAWALDVPLQRVGPAPVGMAPVEGPAVVLAPAGGAEDVRLTADPPPATRALARTEGWAVHAVACAAH